jgi:hypothetical protein
MTIEDLNNILDDLSRGFRPSAKDKERKYSPLPPLIYVPSSSRGLLQSADREHLPHHKREVYS